MMMKAMRWVSRGLMALCLLLSWTAVASGQSRDLTKSQSNQWYGTQFAILGGLTLGSGALLMPPAHRVQPRALKTPRFEREVQAQFSQTTARISDITLLTSTVAPVVTLGLGAREHSWGNSLLIYGEAMGASLLANVAVKRFVRRPRPYAVAENPVAEAERHRMGADAYYSFYSGHSALSFTAASASSVLFSAVNDQASLNAVHWGLSLALASFTAHARVRAGRHYPTDVLVGAVAGLAFGLGLPALQQVKMEPDSPEILAGLSGVLVGAGAAWLLPNTAREEWSRWAPVIVARPGGASFTVSGGF